MKGIITNKYALISEITVIYALNIKNTRIPILGYMPETSVGYMCKIFINF